MMWVQSWSGAGRTGDGFAWPLPMVAGSCVAVVMDYSFLEKMQIIENKWLVAKTSGIK